MSIGNRSTGFASSSPLPSIRQATSSNNRCFKRPVRCAAGKGFGRNEDSGNSNVVSTGREAPWVFEYKSYVRRNGEMLCAMAWEGYERLGRGAVFANYSSNVAIGVARPDTGEFSGTGIPSFYVSREQLIARNEAETIPQMAPILRRIASYDPERQFVVVFESNGTQGADIVTPNQRPEDVWKRARVGNDDVESS